MSQQSYEAVESIFTFSVYSSPFAYTTVGLVSIGIYRLSFVFFSYVASSLPFFSK